MRRLLSLLAVFCLFAALANGAVLHASELAEPDRASAASLWLHADCGAEHAPADAHKNYPHHHGACHGHELAASLRLTGVAFVHHRAIAPPAVPDNPVVTGPTATLLRPPIA